MAQESPGWANQASTYGAEQTRRAVFLPFSSAGGVKASGDLACTAPVSGMTVNVATGEVLVPGSSSASQGLYYGKVTSTTNLAVAASNPSNPRIDMVYAAITDAAYTGATNTFVTAVATGTPTAGATLVNLNGAPALPTSAIILAYILVPATSTNVIDANISDQRVRFVISNAASTTSATTQTFTGNVTAPVLTATTNVVAPYLTVSGFTGSIAASRYMGGTASGAPTTGAHLVGDFVIDQTGKVLICTVLGTPGTWAQAGASGGPALIYTFANPLSATASTAFTANRCHYQRVWKGGTITSIGFRVGTQSGNVCAAVCRGATGRANPTSRVVTSGSVACPASGFATVAVASTVVDETTDHLALAVDNGTATFLSTTGAGGAAGTLALGFFAYQDTAFPVPASPSVAGNDLVATPILIGVP